jgi:hypothetical protein
MCVQERLIGLIRAKVLLTSDWEVAKGNRKFYFLKERIHLSISVAVLMNVRSPSESYEVQEARVEVELEMVADCAHRQALAHLQVLISPH